MQLSFILPQSTKIGYPTKSAPKNIDLVGYRLKKAVFLKDIQLNRGQKV